MLLVKCKNAKLSQIIQKIQHKLSLKILAYVWKLLTLQTDYTITVSAQNLPLWHAHKLEVVCIIHRSVNPVPQSFFNSLSKPCVCRVGR